MLHASVEAATGDRLRARQDCRARVVRGVGAWFGRIEAREKRVGFVLQEQLAWQEEEIVDAYANDDLEHEALLDLPPNILASIDYQPQPSTETVWPTVLIGEEGNGEGYSLRTTGVQPDNTAIMDIEWPVATRDHAVKPYGTHAQDDTRDNVTVQGLGGVLGKQTKNYHIAGSREKGTAARGSNEDRVFHRRYSAYSTMLPGLKLDTVVTAEVPGRLI